MTTRPKHRTKSSSTTPHGTPLANNGGITFGQFLNQLLRFWPLIVVLVGLIALMVETRYQVRQLIQERETDTNQWRVISGNKSDLALLRGEMRIWTEEAARTHDRLQHAIDKVDDELGRHEHQ